MGRFDNSREDPDFKSQAVSLLNPKPQLQLGASLQDWAHQAEDCFHLDGDVARPDKNRHAFAIFKGVAADEYRGLNN